MPIPVGTVCAVDKEDTVRYVTTEEATLKANELSVTVKAKAKEGGCNGNTAENTIQIMITPPSGQMQNHLLAAWMLKMTMHFVHVY